MGRLRRLKKPECRVNQGPNLISFWVNELASQKARCIRRHSDNNLDNNRAKKGLRSNLGFSLVELIIVIAIIAILAAVIAPALIRYIDKSRKAIDVANAELIYKAAEMAATTGSDEAFAGWGYAARYRYTSGNTDVQANILAYTKVTAEGHNSSFDSSGNYYYITCVAWARGINYQSANSTREWENARYKCTLDSRTDPDAANLRQYTDEFLHFLVHDEGNKSAIYGGNGRNPFDGVTAETIKFRYKKDLGHGAAEIWMVCVNCASQTPEIWIGEKNINGRGANRNIRPLYRIYPNPCIEYTE